MIAQILVADDDLDVREMLRDFLETQGHQVLEASDGAQAFAVAEKERPHLIILDVVMPGVYGSTAAKLLAGFRGTQNTPIIIISGSSHKNLIEDILARPNVRYLRKPLDLSVLDAVIQEMLPQGGYTH